MDRRNAPEPLAAARPPDEEKTPRAALAHAKRDLRTLLARVEGRAPRDPRAELAEVLRALLAVDRAVELLGAAPTTLRTLARRGALLGFLTDPPSGVPVVRGEGLEDAARRALDSDHATDAQRAVARALLAEDGTPRERLAGAMRAMGGKAD